MKKIKKHLNNIKDKIKDIKDAEEKIDKITEYIEKHKNIMGFYEKVDGNIIKKILKRRR